VGKGVLTAGFAYRDGTLHCEEVPAVSVAIAAGTPAFVYSASAIRTRYRRLTDALRDLPHRLHYSLKANGNHAILTLLRELGAGADVVSGGELFRARRAGFDPSNIVFGGVGKTARELREAVEARVKLVNAESEDELVVLDRIASELGTTVAVGLRVNPEVTVDAPHHYIRTGERGDKFGIPYDEAVDVARTVLRCGHLRLAGLDMHVGSQLATFDPIRSGLEKLRELHARLTALGSRPQFVDVGGGLRVTYEDAEAEPDLNEYAAVLRDGLNGLDAELIVEPGRYLVADAGVLLTRVLYRKRSGGRDHVVVDAGMTELLRPSHYQAYHRIEAVQPRGPRATVDVVGPVCESGDFLGLAREIDAAEPGDLLAVRGAGAYGYVMSSTYNARPRSPEVMVDGHRYAIVTARESCDDLVRLESDNPEWRDA